MPVLSWLALRGRCASCKAPISFRYPLVELAVGGLFLACAWTWGPTLQTAWGCAFCLLCLPLGLIDLEHQILPDKLTYPGIAAGLTFAAAGEVIPWRDALVGAAAGALIPAAVIGAYWLLRQQEGMGWGDVKLLGMIGAFLGWKGMLLTLLAGAFLGTLIGGGYLLLSGRGRQDAPALRDLPLRGGARRPLLRRLGLAVVRRPPRPTPVSDRRRGSRSWLWFLLAGAALAAVALAVHIFSLGQAAAQRRQWAQDQVLARGRVVRQAFEHGGFQQAPSTLRDLPGRGARPRRRHEAGRPLLRQPSRVGRSARPHAPSRDAAGRPGGERAA